MGFLAVSSKLVLFTAILMVVAVLPLVSSSSSSSTVTYKVGDDDDDDAGWSSHEPPLMGDSVSNSYNGNGWISSSSKAFHVGDTIRFEYNPHNYQTVMQVTPIAYDLCDHTSPLAVFATGNDSITFNNTGHYYFILGPGGGCVQGKMLNIYVHEPEEDGNNISAVPALAPAAVCSPSSSAVAASSLTPPSSDDDLYDDCHYPLFMLMMIILALMFMANT